MILDSSVAFLTLNVRTRKHTCTYGDMCAPESDLKTHDLSVYTAAVGSGLIYIEGGEMRLQLSVISTSLQDNSPIYRCCIVH